MLPSDLYFSTKSTKFVAVKGTNQTYNCPEEFVKFWMVSVSFKWIRFVLKIQTKNSALNTNCD